MATESILDSVKETLGVPVDEPAFDNELMLHINSVLSNLRQLGVGPAAGLQITDNTATWTDFLGADASKLGDTKTYAFLRVKMLFDPPATSFVIDAMKEQIRESEWRINVTREETGWVDPDPVVTDPTLF